MCFNKYLCNGFVQNHKNAYLWLCGDDNGTGVHKILIRKRAHQITIFTNEKNSSLCAKQEVTWICVCVCVVTMWSSDVGHCEMERRATTDYGTKWSGISMQSFTCCFCRCCGRRRSPSLSYMYVFLKRGWWWQHLLINFNRFLFDSQTKRHKIKMSFAEIVIILAILQKATYA